MYDAAVALVARDDVAGEERHALETGAVVCRREEVARYRLTGPGREACLQGLVTCDVATAERGSQLFGALLTAKGMIVSLVWVTPLPEEFLLEAPGAGAARLEETFAHSLPPRLCRWESVTAATASVGLYGPLAVEVLDAATAGPSVMPAPLAPQRAAARGVPGFDCVVPAERADTFIAWLVAAGAVPASPALLEACRILAGIPRLGAEIDSKTLPQEARLEELGAVSYTKGCYLGQETVARLHFRGHPNRSLVGLTLQRAPTHLPQELVHHGRPVGRLSSAAWSDALGAYFGLAVVRREVRDGAEVLLPDGSGGVVRQAAWQRSA